MANEIEVRAGSKLDDEEQGIEGLSLNGLRVRIALGELLVRKLQTDWAKDDEGGEALKKYMGQLADLEDELERRQQKPPPNVIHANMALLGAKKG